MGKFIDLTGQRFGRWTVLEYAGYDNGVKWKCRCECGRVKIVRSDHLRYGKSTSCGCFKGEVTAKETAQKIRKHGMWNTRLYHIWQRMKQRCSPSCPKHEKKRYYERGIRVCEEWEKDFEKFKEWALQNGYADNLSIDRINNDGNYCPENCRWETNKNQSNNRSVTKYIEYNGEVRPMAIWSELMGIPYSTLQKRLIRGWTVEKALTMPVQKKRVCK